MTGTADPTDGLRLRFDPAALRERYRVERDKRVRRDGIAQYQEAVGNLAHVVEDPYAEPLVRDPLHDEVDVVVLGGGLGGLLAGAKLRDVGIERVRIIDKAGDFGGTWYWNRYPGAQCDVESYIYMPLLEELGHVPTEKYARQPEIFEHCRAIGRKYRLYDHACFQTECTAMAWDEADSRWVVSTDRGDTIRTRFVVVSSGPLSKPKLPGIPGIDLFKGHTFHTSRWDYGYTGGGHEGNLTRLADKRVAIIGTGATAIQAIPHLGAAAAHLYVFQRTPSSISERGNRPTDPAWAESLQHGWQRQRMTNFNTIVSGGAQDVDLVSDAWTAMFRTLATFLASQDGSDDRAAELSELADFQTMEQLRARVDTVVEDPATAEALKPWYRMFCKRPCFSDDYLPTFNRPNVSLVETDGQGVERFTERGVVAGGVEYEVDCVIFATGFEVGTSYTRRLGFEVIGRRGARLSERWADGPRTLHGFYSHGFPNWFFLGATQGGFTVNFQHMLLEQSEHVAYVVRTVLDAGCVSVEVTEEAEDEWVRTIREKSTLNQAFLAECTPGFFNNEGNPGSPHSLQAGAYGDGPDAFFELLRRWREDATLAGLRLSSRPT